MKFLLGTKDRMTQFFTEDGKAFAATLVKTSPLVVTHIKTQEADGYDAVQVGYQTQKESRVNKPQQGHTKELGFFKVLKEFKLSAEQIGTYKKGDVIDISVFFPNDTITVSGISKGKGFQGVVKRHGFAGGRRTHGQKHSEREAGSIGGGLRTRVPKGMRMAGRMGSDVITVKNLSILAVDPANQLLVIKGAVPGKPGTLLEITG